MDVLGGWAGGEGGVANCNYKGAFFYYSLFHGTMCSNDVIVCLGSACPAQGPFHFVDGKGLKTPHPKCRLYWS